MLDSPIASLIRTMTIGVTEAVKDCYPWHESYFISVLNPEWEKVQSDYLAVQIAYYNGNRHGKVWPTAHRKTEIWDDEAHYMRVVPEIAVLPGFTANYMVVNYLDGKPLYKVKSCPPQAGFGPDPVKVAIDVAHGNVCFIIKTKHRAPTLAENNLISRSVFPG
jgi:hypothetical protein